MGRYDDLTGRVYGRLKVMYKAASHKGRTCWLCRCKCGKEKIVSAHDLKSGHVKSCGCMKYERSYNFVDLSGRKLAKGISRYSFDEVDRIKRKKSQDIDAILGFDHGAVVVHRDDLVVLGS